MVGALQWLERLCMGRVCLSKHRLRCMALHTLQCDVIASRCTLLVSNHQPTTARGYR